MASMPEMRVGVTLFDSARDEMAARIFIRLASDLKNQYALERFGNDTGEAFRLMAEASFNMANAWITERNRREEDHEPA